MQTIPYEARSVDKNSDELKARRTGVRYLISMDDT